VMLIHAKGHLSPSLDQKLGDHAARKLRRRGLHILLNRSVKAVPSKMAYLHDDTSIDTNTVGNAPHSLVQSFCRAEGLPHHHGRMVTEGTRRCPGTKPFGLRATAPESPGVTGSSANLSPNTPTARAPELIEKMLMHGTHKVLFATEDGKLLEIVALLDLIPDAKQAEPDSPAPVPRISE